MTHATLIVYEFCLRLFTFFLKYGLVVVDIAFNYEFAIYQMYLKMFQNFI